MNLLASRHRAVLTTALILSISPTRADAVDRDIEAGALWTDLYAQKTCPQVCTGAGAKSWTGQWHTTKPGRQSVCSCRFDGSGGDLRSSKPAKGVGSGGPVIDVEARSGLGNDWNAKDKCPKLCEEKGLTWTGKWAFVPNWTIRWTCSCR